MRNRAKKWNWKKERGVFKNCGTIASVINRRVISRYNKGMPCETAVPMAGETRVSRARVLTPAIISARGRVEERATLLRVTVGSEGGQGQEFLGVRECLLVHTGRVAPETRERELSRGRSPTAARTLLLVEEDSPVRGCQHPFFSLVQLHGGKRQF